VAVAVAVAVAVTVTVTDMTSECRSFRPSILQMLLALVGTARMGTTWFMDTIRTLAHHAAHLLLPPILALLLLARLFISTTRISSTNNTISANHPTGVVAPPITQYPASMGSIPLSISLTILQNRSCNN